MLAENEKLITSAGIQPVLEQIKQDIAAISTDGYVTTEALNTILEGYLTAVPAEYVTEDELTAKGYVTAADLPVATSDEVLALYTGTTEQA